MSSRRCRLGRPHSQAPNRASAVVAARLSDAEARGIRLNCHEHRRRRGTWGWCRSSHIGHHGHHRYTGGHDHDDESTPNDEPNEEPNEEPMAAGFTTRKSDFEIGIKILEKKCFGSAGCSVTYRIKPKYIGTQELN
jgi:hypothetical protein